jgi:EAL domain-containing protein (putative c-di-GMP-specific phosphodiesterase class I)
MKRLFVLLLLGLITVPGITGNKADSINILLIHSYHQEYPWTVSQHNAFVETLQASLPEYNIVFSTEYLDTKRVEPSGAYKKSFLQYLASKYKDHVPDLIYTSDDNAFDFLHSGEFRLLWKSPVVFSGLNNPHYHDDFSEENITGVYEIKDIVRTLELAKQLSSTDNIIFLGDGGTTDRAIDNWIKTRPEQSDITHIQQAEIGKVLDELNSIKPTVIVLTTIGGMRDRSGHLLSLQETIHTIAGTGHKILVMEDAYLHPDILGGYITSGHMQGATAAKLALRIIKGQYAKDLKPVINDQSELVLDWNMLQELDLHLDKALLKTARVINKPLPLLKQHHKIIKWLLIFVCVLLVIIAIFAYNARQKNRLLNEQRIDHLTGLGNRIKLLQDIEEMYNPYLAVININDFKVINNLYGLEIGDAIIASYAHQTHNRIGKKCSLYRLSGDRLGILQNVITSPQSFGAHIGRIINYIQSNQYSVGELDINLTITAGISGGNKALLIPRAEQALQQAKESNKPYVIINGSTDNTKKQKENIFWAQKLHSALEEDRVIPFFQPIVNNKTGRILEHEALVRIIDEDGSIVSPFFFLNAAKTTRQYEQLTHSMIKQAVGKVKKQSSSISINFTVEDIRNKKTVHYLKEEISQHNVADRVIIELTESEGIENYSEVAKFIDEIKQLGCRVSIDDFGSGYSNFTHLIHLNADYLKIDGSIIKDILTDKDSELVAQSIVDFAKCLNMQTIAEFVDSREVLEKVTALGVDYSQGYFIGKPDPEPR